MNRVNELPSQKCYIIIVAGDAGVAGSIKQNYLKTVNN
jgi:hypothetical protein